MINYILLPVFVLFVVVYKFWKKTRWVRLEEMDIWTGRREFPASEELPDKKPSRWLTKVREIFVG